MFTDPFKVDPGVQGMSTRGSNGCLITTVESNTIYI